MEQIDKELEDLKLLGAALKERLQTLQKELPEQKEKLQQFIIEETALRNYFEEELDLKLILSRDGRTVYECAREAVKILRESDKNREPGELLQALHTVYLKHNGSLASYGTAMEECFGDTGNIDAVRKRVRILSVWNGKKVYLEEFYNILKTAIEETELLIQKKDRELFEDILSQTISQQLTDRIAESRKWAKTCRSSCRRSIPLWAFVFPWNGSPAKPTMTKNWIQRIWSRSFYATENCLPWMILKK